MIQDERLVGLSGKKMRLMEQRVKSRQTPRVDWRGRAWVNGQSLQTKNNKETLDCERWKAETY